MYSLTFTRGFCPQGLKTMNNKVDLVYKVEHMTSLRYNTQSLVDQLHRFGAGPLIWIYAWKLVWL